MPTTLRVSVLARGTVHDLAVGPGTMPEQVLAALALPPGPLRLPDGALLHPGAPLGAQGVRSGVRLLADGEPARTDAAAGGPGHSATADPVGNGVRIGLTGLGAALLVGAAAVIAALPEGRRVPAALLLVGVAALLGTAMLLGSALLSSRTSAGDSALRPAIPLVIGAAVAAAIAGRGAGAPLLAATASMVTVAATASVLRADARVPKGGLTETALLLELVGGAVLAAASGIALLADASVRALALLLAGATLPVLRLLPAGIVRVPDEALLDVRGVAVTAWSLEHGDESDAGAGAGAEARAPVSDEEVSDRIRRHRSLLDGAVVTAVGVGVTCLGVGLLQSRGTRAGHGEPVGTVEQIGAGLVALALVGGLALLSREVRGLVAKVAMLAGAAVGLGMGGAWVLTLGPAARIAAAAGGVVSAAVLVLLAVARGRSWRSLRWARVGDLGEGAAVALSLPAALVAIGLVDFVRSLVS